MTFLSKHSQDIVAGFFALLAIGFFVEYVKARRLQRRLEQDIIESRKRINAIMQALNDREASNRE